MLWKSIVIKLVFIFILCTFIGCGGYDKEIDNAKKKIDEGDYNAAVTILTDVVHNEPSEVRAHFFLGIAYNKLERYEEAAKELEIALSLDSRNIEAQFQLGKALWHLERKLGALKAFRDYLQGEPKNERVREIMQLTGEIYHVSQITRSKTDCSSPDFSPDGNYIVFVRVTPNLTGKIYIMDTDGKNEKMITPENCSDFTPSFSPDGKKIIFSSGIIKGEEFHKTGIYTMDIDGKNRKLLVENSLLRSNPTYSNDGSKILYEVETIASRQIVIANADGSNPEKLIPQTENTNRWGSFSPDDKRVAFTTTRNGNFAIYSININRTNEIKLTQNIRAYMPDYSYDGTKIAFVSDSNNENPEIYIMDSDGSNIQRLTNSKGEDVSPSFSPDNKKIAFVSIRNSSYRQVCIIDLTRKLTEKELIARIRKQISIYQ